MKQQMGISTNIKIGITDKKITRIKKDRSIIMMARMINPKDNKLKNKDNSSSIPSIMIKGIIIVNCQNITIRKHVL